MDTKPNRQIHEEAAAWFIEFRAGDKDARIREQFNEWLRRSPEHIRAYLEISETYAALPESSPLATADMQQLIATARSQNNVVELSRRAGPSQGWRSKAINSRRPLLAAALAVLCVGLLTWYGIYRDPAYSTQIGEHRSITLADGSIVQLNARSRVRIRFTESERLVELIEGQALFEVAKEARRFTVLSDDTLVHAVGTQFDVNRKRSGIVVTVLEGTVAVERSTSAQTLLPRDAGSGSQTAPVVDAARTAAVVVTAGEQVAVKPQSVEQHRAVNVAAAVAWTDRRLIFDETPLGEVVDEFNRYNARQLVIEDSALAQLHISGVYVSTDPGSLLRFLATQPGIDIDVTQRQIRLSSRSGF